MLNLELMTSTALISMLIKLTLFLVASMGIHFLLSWMDKRSDGGFNAWREIVITKAKANDQSHYQPMRVLGYYYCIRYPAILIFAAFLLSSS